MSRRPTRVCLAIAALAVVATGCSSSSKRSLARAVDHDERGSDERPGRRARQRDPRWCAVRQSVRRRRRAQRRPRHTVPVDAASGQQRSLRSHGVRRRRSRAGCGAPGAEIVPWVYAHDRYIYSTNSLPWPDNGSAATFAPTYSSSTPAGAAPVLAEFTGAVYKADGVPVSAGTRVEAFVGTTRCGVASVRNTIDFNGYVLAVVGPESIPGCHRGAPVTFRVDGQAGAARPRRQHAARPARQPRVEDAVVVVAS